MKKVHNIFIYILSGIFIWGIFNTVKPYWEKYWLEKQLENIAVFGTKHNINETTQMLSKKMIESGYNFDNENIIINKNEDNSVSIKISYRYEISVFGRTLKQLDFVAKAKATEVKTIY